MNFITFRFVLTNLSIALDNQPRPSAHTSPKNGPIPDDVDGSPLEFSWWDARPKPAPALTPRTKVFLLAYITATQGQISSRGIELSDGWVWPDRDIMKGMTKASILEFIVGSPSQFRLTEIGRNFLLANV